jgi:hypothetical protein
MLHLSSLFFLPLAVVLVFLAEGKFSLSNSLIYLLFAFTSSLLLVSSFSLRILSYLYSLILGSSVLSDKLDLYMNSVYSLVEYPSVSYRGISLLLFSASIASLSLGRRTLAFLSIPFLAVVLSIMFPQGTVLSHRFFQSARFFAPIPLSILFSFLLSFLLRIPKRKPQAFDA